MKKLAISFITYNRAKHIKEGLDIMSLAAKQHGIDIYIYDGSTNTQTEYVVKQFMENGHDHIHYFHADKDLSPVDNQIQRLDNALKGPDAEYVWMCGDRFVIKPEYYSEIMSYIDKSYDIITIYERILNGTKIFHKPDKFACYAIVPLTNWGSTIIKKNLIEKFDLREELDKILSFTISSIYLQAIDKRGFKGVVIDGGKQAKIVSRYKTKSGSLSTMWSDWVINWHQFIEGLPSVYDGVKKYLFNKPDLQMRFFSLDELLRQRSEGQFDWKLYMKCRKYVKKVIVMPNVVVFAIAILPRNIAKWLYDMKRWI